MSDFEDRFLRDCRNPDVKNADNEWLGAVHAGPFTMGYVDEVNGPGATEVPFSPTRHELIQLVKYWTRTVLDIEFEWFCYPCYGGSESRQLSFAACRVYRITSAIGQDDVRKAIKEIFDELANEREEWRIFLRGTSEEKSALQRQIRAALPTADRA